MAKNRNCRRVEIVHQDHQPTKAEAEEVIVRRNKDGSGATARTLPVPVPLSSPSK
ncbi:MAG: hypothetical protein OXF11_08230 [Deltaproteobacteria bacterium]|nr:hypothetical protein [Deltaproteobacteria bacterium]